MARAAVALENDERLDPAVHKAAQATRPLRDSAAGSALRGEWMGHALHPAVTDLPMGLFTATAVLDLFGGPGRCRMPLSRVPAQRRVRGGGHD